jgi:hypothetical protein
MSSTSFGRSIGGTASVTAGTTQTQAGATELTGAVNLVTTGNANDGVILQADRVAGDVVYVVNLSANALKLYPSSGGDLNGGTDDAAVVIAANATATCVNTGSDNWGVVRDTDT